MRMNDHLARGGFAALGRTSCSTADVEGSTSVGAAATGAANVGDGARETQEMNGAVAAADCAVVGGRDPAAAAAAGDTEHVCARDDGGGSGGGGCNAAPWAPSAVTAGEQLADWRLPMPEAASTRNPRCWLGQPRR